MNKVESPLAVRVHKKDEVQLRELTYLVQYYHCAMTPHLGRKWRSDQAAAQLGVPLQNILTTQSVRDTIDRPEYFQYQDLLYPMTKNGLTEPILAPYLQFSDNLIPSVFLDELRRAFKKPMELHLKTAEKVLGSSVQLYTYGQQEDALLELQRLLMRKGFCLFDRVASPQGTVIKKDLQQTPELVEQCATFSKELMSMVTLGTNINPEGPLMRNTVNIFCDLIISLLEQKKAGTLENPAKAVLMCGPSMIAYMHEKARLEELSAMYMEASSYYGLPKVLNVELIPLDRLETLCHTGESEATEILREIIRSKKEIEERGEVIRKALPVERAALIKEKNTKSVYAKGLYKNYSLYLSTRKSFFHLDALSSGERMCTSEIQIPGILTLTLRDLKKLGPVPTHNDQCI